MEKLMKEMLSCLEVRSVTDLLPHEQTIPYNLKRLKVAMLNVGQIVDPILIDKKTGLVIDGNHRRKVLEIMEVPFAPVQTVDYMRKDITVGTWYPSVPFKPKQLFTMESVHHEKVDYETGKKAVQNLKAAFMVMSKKHYYLINPGNYKLKEMVEEQNHVLFDLEKMSVDYIAEPDISDHLARGNSVLFRRSYTKAEIIKTAQDHSPFPPKSTRHLVPGRIIRLNMKLGWLNRTKEHAKKEMQRTLNNRVYSGNVRKYYEPVTVIY